jgi:ribonuclease BN (tRNA processing enzyme)
MKIYTLNNREFSLTNNGDLELFFIGVGGAFTRSQYQTNLLIVKGDDHILIDCGTKCPQAFAELGMPITDVNNFLITHSHADHIGGLEEVALLGRYFKKRKPTMVINETYQHILWDMSLRGGAAYNEEEASIMLSFGDFFDIIRPHWVTDFPRETFIVEVEKLNIKMMRTKHVPDSSSDWMSSFWSCGIIIDDRIMFTSDTRFDFDLIDYFEKQFRFEAIFHDCQFFTGGVHASLEELNQLPAEYKTKIYLSHYGDNWEDFVDKVKEFGFAGLAKQHVYYNFDK